MQIDWKKGFQGSDDPTYQQCMAASTEIHNGEELEVAMAEVIHTLKDHYKYQKEPAEPTVLMNYRYDKKDPAFRAMPGNERHTKVGRLFARDDVKSYMDKCGTILSENYANVRMLEEQMAIWFKWEETEKATDMHEIYQTYPDTLKMGVSEVWKKKRKDYGKCSRIRGGGKT